MAVDLTPVPGQKAWIVDVNMGYGHSRAAHNIKDLGAGVVISANDYKGIPSEDKQLWKQSREVYETISRLKPIPVVGDYLFEVMDHWQQIPSFYPRRDLSKPSLQTRSMYRLIKKGMGRHLIEQLAKNPLPIVATFFLPAFFAEAFDYPGDIYVVTTDADIARAWAPLDPKKSRIKYFASNGRVAERLKLYGVREENIFLTGFPLPKKLIGGASSSVLKDLLMQRLKNLDPQNIFHDRYQQTLKAHLGAARCRAQKDLTCEHPLTLTYTVGGAGAQKKLGVDVLKSLRSRIRRHEIRLNLVAGVRKPLVKYFQTAVKELGLSKELGEWVRVPEFDSREAYFEGFDDILLTTDILWTKPSEMSFYTGLGIAIVMAPPIGSQEEFNRVWLDYVGGGVPQNDARYTDEWLFDWIHSGGMARMAFSGFTEAPTHGAHRIEDLVLGKTSELKPLPLIV